MGLSSSSFSVKVFNYIEDLLCQPAGVHKMLLAFSYMIPDVIVSV